MKTMEVINQLNPSSDDWDLRIFVVSVGLCLVFGLGVCWMCVRRRKFRRQKKLAKEDAESGDGELRVVTDRDYKMIIEQHFPDCPQCVCMYANSFDEDFTAEDKTRLADKIAFELMGMGVDAVEPAAQFEALRLPLAHYCKVVESNLIGHNAARSSPFDHLFENCCRRARAELNSAKLITNAIGIFQKGTADSIVNDFVAKAEALPFFKARVAHELIVAKQGELFLQEYALQQTRLVMVRAFQMVCAELHESLWEVFKDFSIKIMGVGGRTSKTDQEKANNSTVAKILTQCLELTRAADNEGNADSEPVLDFPDPPEIIECISNGLPDPKIASAEYDKWFRFTTHDLQDFSDGKTFPWFLTGYHMAKAEDYFTSAMLGVGETTVSLGDDELLVDMSEFPNCYAELPNFSKHVDGWVRELASATEGDFPGKLLDSIHEAATIAGTVLCDSNLFRNANPLSAKLGNLALRMISQLMLAYDVETTSEVALQQARHKWTPFAEELFKSMGVKDLERLDCESTSLMQVADPPTSASLPTVMHTMTKIHAIMKSFVIDTEAPELGDQSEDHDVCQLSRIIREMGHKLDKAKLYERLCTYGLASKTGKPSWSSSATTDMESWTPPTSGNEVYLGGFGFVDLREARQTLQSMDVFHGTIKQQESHPEQNGSMVQQISIIFDDIRRYKPLVLIMARRKAELTGEPSDAEVKFLQQLKTHAPSIGCVVWIHTLEMVLSKWTKTAGNIKMIQLRRSCVTMPLMKRTEPNQGISVVNVKLTDKPALESDLVDLFQDADASLKKRVQRGLKVISNARAFFLAEVTKFKDLKALRTESTPEDFYQNVVKLTRIPLEQEVTYKENVDPLHLPDRSMLNLQPFLVVLAEQMAGGVDQKRVDELKTRSFLKSVLRTQITQRGKERGRHLYDNMVEKWIEKLIGQYFGIPSPKIMDLLRHHAPSDASGFKADSHSAAAFLMRDHFVCMYMGGMVLSCAPLLDSMVGSQLIGEDKKPTALIYARTIQCASEYHKAMVTQHKALVRLPSDVTMSARLQQVQRHLEFMFTNGDELSVMKNLITEVAGLIHTALDAGEKDLMHLFKARLRSRYWRAGKDATMFTPTEVQTGKPSMFVDALDELMDVIHRKIAQTNSISRKRMNHPLLLCPEVFFSLTVPAASDGDSASSQTRITITKAHERTDAMKFLSKAFNFVHVMESQMIHDPQERSKIMSKVGSALAAAGINNVDALKSRIGCAYMSLKLMRTMNASDGESDEEEENANQNQKSQLVRSIFVGMESAGKSSLINFLTDPLGDRKRPLPTDVDQCTQAITVVRHGEEDLWYVGDNLRRDGDVGLFEQMTAAASEVAGHKSRRKVSLETPLSTRVTPFQPGWGQTMNLELVDVPGIRKNTELDTALALGVGTCIVLCCDDAYSLGMELATGDNLPRLKRLYANLVSPLPIVLAVTRPTEDAKHDYDRSTFRLTSTPSSGKGGTSGYKSV